MTSLLLVPLEDVVVFPNMTVTLPLELGSEPHVLLVPKHEGAYAKVGTVAEVVERGRLPALGDDAVGRGRNLRGLGAANLVDIEETRDDCDENNHQGDDEYEKDTAHLRLLPSWALLRPLPNR